MFIFEIRIAKEFSSKQPKNREYGINMGVLSNLINIPFVAKTVLKAYKKNAFKPFRVPLQEAFEKQERTLKTKLEKLAKTNIGKKMGAHRNLKLKDLPITDYSFYETFYNNPKPQDFMFPLKDYVRIKTSGTAGKEKVYLRPRQKVLTSFMETGVPAFFAAFHDGDKITLNYGDNFYVNMGPAPFAAGSTFSLVSKEKKVPFFNIIPNVNLPYNDKVRYFISNHEKIDGAIMLASTLICQVMPAIGKPIKLKGLLMPDTPEVEMYMEDIREFTGVTPRTAYASTETIACSIPSVQHTLGFIFDLRRGVYEFAPTEKSDEDQQYLPLNEVTVGQTYRLIYTDLESEITRFDTKDAVKCIAYGDDILETDYPIFKFQARTDKTISLHNFTRIDEEELITVMREAKIPFVEFTAKLESEQGHEYLSIYIELGEKENQEKFQNKLHQQLTKTDEDYQNLTNYFDYIPLKTYIVPKGTFAKYLEQKEGSMAKVDRINMREEEFAKLSKLMEITAKNDQ